MGHVSSENSMQLIISHNTCTIPLQADSHLNIKVCDFGLARQLPMDKCEMAGTPNYVAPEVTIHVVNIYSKFE